MLVFVLFKKEKQPNYFFGISNTRLVEANTLQFSTQSNAKFELNILKSIKIRSICYTFEIPLQIASRWSWPDTVKNTGLSKYSPSFCAID